MRELIVLSGEPDGERRGCVDCRYMRAAVSWWCVNESARRHRGTSLPGCKGCEFWAPARKAGFFERLFRFLDVFDIYIRCEEER